MSTIISTLITHDMTPGGGIDERQNFTAVIGHAATDVPVNAAGAGVGLLRPGLVGGFSGYKLMPGDNFNIIGVGVILPYFFIQSVECFTVYFSWLDNHGISGNFSNVGDAGYMILPSPNYELAAGIFVPWPTAATPGDKIKLFMTITAGRVSMYAAPSAWDTLNFPVIAFLKISHNMGLSA